MTLSICCHVHLTEENMDSHKRTHNNSSIPKTLLLFSLICLLLALCIIRPLHAAPTDAPQAETMVTGWLRINPRPLDERLGDRVARTEVFPDQTGRPLYYVVSLEPEGFVIVPADKSTLIMRPVSGEYYNHRSNAHLAPRASSIEYPVSSIKHRHPGGHPGGTVGVLKKSAVRWFREQSLPPIKYFLKHPHFAVVSAHGDNVAAMWRAHTVTFHRKCSAAAARRLRLITAAVR
jgi:hypothetical protein